MCLACTLSLPATHDSNYSVVTANYTEKRLRIRLCIGGEEGGYVFSLAVSAYIKSSFFLLHYSEVCCNIFLKPLLQLPSTLEL